MRGSEPLFTYGFKVKSPYSFANLGAGASQRLAVQAEIADVNYFRYAVHANREETPVFDETLFNLQPRSEHTVESVGHLAFYVLCSLATEISEAPSAPASQAPDPIRSRLREGFLKSWQPWCDWQTERRITPLTKRFAFPTL